MQIQCLAGATSNSDANGEDMLGFVVSNKKEVEKYRKIKAQEEWTKGSTRVYSMIVTRKNNKNVVMLSEESNNNLMENVYIMGNKANYE